MPAYLFAFVREVLDPAALQHYVDQVIPIMAKHGGGYKITSFGVTTLEGNIALQGVAMAEFPSAEQLHAFWNSPEYQPLSAST